jgi:hypothetical protein
MWAQSRRRCGPVPAQMWAQSRRRCGRSPGADVGAVPAQMWASPGADVGAVRAQMSGQSGRRCRASPGADVGPVRAQPVRWAQPCTARARAPPAQAARTIRPNRPCAAACSTDCVSSQPLGSVGRIGPGRPVPEQPRPLRQLAVTIGKRRQRGAGRRDRRAGAAKRKAAPRAPARPSRGSRAGRSRRPEADRKSPWAERPQCAKAAGGAESKPRRSVPCMRAPVPWRALCPVPCPVPGGARKPRLCLAGGRAASDPTQPWRHGEPRGMTAAQAPAAPPCARRRRPTAPPPACQRARAA